MMRSLRIEINQTLLVYCILLIVDITRKLKCTYQKTQNSQINAIKQSYNQNSKSYKMVSNAWHLFDAKFTIVNFDNCQI